MGREQENPTSFPAVWEFALNLIYYNLLLKSEDSAPTKKNSGLPQLSIDTLVEKLFEKYSCGWPTQPDAIL